MFKVMRTRITISLFHKIRFFVTVPWADKNTGLGVLVIENNLVVRHMRLQQKLSDLTQIYKISN